MGQAVAYTDGHSVEPCEPASTRLLPSVKMQVS